MKILIVKTSSLGDIIHTFPVLEYLHEHYPLSKIDWVVEAPFAPLLEGHPYVKTVYRIDSREWRNARNLKLFFQFFRVLRRTRYDLLLDFQGNMKSALINFFAKAKHKVGFGKKTVSEWPNLLTTNYKADPDCTLNVRQENLFLVHSFFQKSEPYLEKGVRLKISEEEEHVIQEILANLPNPQNRKIMVCPGSAWPNKQMTTESLTEFLIRVIEDSPSSFLLIWGNETERQVALEIQKNIPKSCTVLDRLPLPVLQNFMDRMDLVIAMDSLPLHLAGTTSTKTFGVFGASSGKKYQPNGEKHHSFQGNCPYGKTFSRRCPILRTCPTGACIRQLNVEALFNEFKECLLSDGS